MKTSVSKLILLFSIVVFQNYTLLAQNTIIETTSDFGKGIIFADGTTSLNGPSYTYVKLDNLHTVILYDTFFSFTDNPQEGIKDEMLLQIGKKWTKFYSPLLHACDSALQSGGRQIGFRTKILSKANPVFINDCYYTDLASGELTFVCRFATEDFEYKESPLTIDWTIGKEKRMICGYECRNATGRFRGRIYNVWFSESLPSSSGPWKLRGLPGAILFAEDSEGLCRFEAKSVTTAAGSIEKPNYPYIKISRKEYRSMLEQYFKTPGRFISMHMSRTPGIVHTPPAKETPLPGIVLLEKQ